MKPNEPEQWTIKTHETIVINTLASKHIKTVKSPFSESTMYYMDNGLETGSFTSILLVENAVNDYKNFEIIRR